MEHFFEKAFLNMDEDSRESFYKTVLTSGNGRLRDVFR